MMLWVSHRRFLIALSLILAVASVRAHRLDEYLQATLIEVRQKEVLIQLNLTPGVDVSDSVLRLIDKDKDGKISSAEGKAYAKAVVGELELRLDDRVLKLDLLRETFDAVSELKTGEGNVRIEMRARLGRLEEGEHVLSFENRHEANISVYLVNAVFPKERGIKIQRQDRNANQSVGRIYFTLGNGGK
jgi:hypothetical protein